MARTTPLRFGTGVEAQRAKIVRDALIYLAYEARAENKNALASLMDNLAGAMSDEVAAKLGRMLKGSL